MNEEQETQDTDTAEDPGLLDRYSELFEEEGVPKAGTEELLSDESQPESTEEPPEAEKEEPEEVDDPATEESTEDKDTGKDTDEEPDAFDQETKELQDSMSNDPHPGIKFAELRKQLKEAQAQVSEVKAEATNTEEFQSLKLKSERVDELEAELSEMQKRLSVVDFQSTPDYKREVEQPLSEINDLASVIEKENGIDAGAIARAVNLSEQSLQNSAIETLVDEHGLSKRDEVRLYNMADQVILVNSHKAQLQEVAQQRMSELNEMQVSEQAYEKELKDRNLAQAVNSTFERFDGKLPGFVSDDGTGNDQWNTLKEQTTNSGIQSVDDEAHAIFAANALPMVLDHVKDLSKQLQEKNTLLARYTKAKPSKDVSGTTAPEVKTNEVGTFMDRLNNLQF